MTYIKEGFLMALAYMLLSLACQAAAPYVGYVFPAGAKVGEQIQVCVGGQRLRRVNQATITGTGIHVEFVEYREPERKTIMRLRRERDLVLAEIAARKERGESIEGLQVPKLPKYRRNPRAQPNAQIEETVVLNVTIDADAQPGTRELRLCDPRGVSNPIRFCVGVLDEVTEPDTKPQGRQFRQPAPMRLPQLPITLNGRILPGEEDRFRFQAKKGETLIFDLEGRALIPYLADAVPGWFQAVLSIHDTSGKELAYVDDYDFNPDPVVVFQPPADGDYELRVRDAIHRGREDFVYRIAMGKLPFVTDVFPLGGQRGSHTRIQLHGFNLAPHATLELDTRNEGRFEASLASIGTPQQTVAYGVDAWPDVFEQEASSTPQALHIPCVVNGRISNAADADVFSFHAQKGDELIAEVIARRLNSPLDAILTVADATGRVLCENDDFVDRTAGLVTHHADAYVRFTVPENGRYTVTLRDVQGKGSPRHAYRLRIGPSRPDFSLRVVPSAVSVPIAGSAAVTVHAIRRDGFDGDITVELDDPTGTLSLNGVVPAGEESARMTLSASPRATWGPVRLHCSGKGFTDGAAISHEAIPAEDRMQAFLWRFLVPAQEWAVYVRAPDRVTMTPELPSGQVLQVPAGGSAALALTLKIRGKKRKGSMRLLLDDPPRGLSMQPVVASARDKRAQLRIDADEELVKVGARGYLIIAGFAGPHNTLLSMAPAIPYEIVE